MQRGIRRIPFLHQLIYLGDGGIDEAALSALTGHTCISAEIDGITSGERGFGDGSLVFAASCKNERGDDDAYYKRKDSFHFSIHSVEDIYVDSCNRERSKLTEDRMKKAVIHRLYFLEVFWLKLLNY